MNTLHTILTRTPVNKLASVVVNQCGCSDELELNNLIEQRDTLRKNLTLWMRQSGTGRGQKRRCAPLIKRGNDEIKHLNRQLKPFDKWHRDNKPKDFEHAFRMLVREVYGKEAFDCLKAEAESMVLD